jgi:hypothetical protein
MAGWMLLICRLFASARGIPSIELCWHRRVLITFLPDFPHVSYLRCQQKGHQAMSHIEENTIGNHTARFHGLHAFTATTHEGTRY